MAKKPTKTLEEWEVELETLSNDRDFEKLQIEALTCREEYPNNYTGPYYLSLALHNLNRFHDAIEYFGKAIRLNPKLAKLYDYRGISLTSLDNHEGAIEEYNKAIEIDPEYADPDNNRNKKPHPA